MTPNLLLTYIFIALFALFALTGLLKRESRNALWLAAGFAATAAVSAYYDAFWSMVVLGMLALWAAFTALNWIDFGWRFRFGLVVIVGALGLIGLWPTLSKVSGGRVPCPAWVKERNTFELVAGLDLRGGLRLVYTVDVDEAIKDKRDQYYEQMRRQLAKVLDLHKGDEPPPEAVYAKLREKVVVEPSPTRPNAIKLTVNEGLDPSRVDSRFLDMFRGELTFSRSQNLRVYEFAVKDSVESSIRERAVNQAREIILRRVDELGLREASVSTRGEDVIVEVPGEDEKSFANIRDIISQTARLEFKLLDDETDFFDTVKSKLDAQEPKNLPPGLEFLRENATIGLDAEGDTRTNTITYAYLRKQKTETMQQALTRFREWVGTLALPPDREIGYEIEFREDPETLKQEEDGIRTYLLKSRAEVTGDMIRDAQAMPNQDQSSMGGWYVALDFTDQGGRLFDTITGANIKRRFAIILDGRVQSAPVIQTRISGGSAQITMGGPDPQAQLRDAKKLELVLRSGALPAPISPSNEQRIGPSLGQDSIDLAVRGAVGGGLIALVFMYIYYRRAGLIANTAVLMNLMLQLAILASFGAAMTLPGIAGLALTIGMSLDANVLINERIKEELRNGKAPRSAVEVGYSRAFTAIVDGHVTTMISGVVLAQYGTGPIKGFAITLMVGVVCSIFTGVFVSRALFDLWMRGFGSRSRFSMG
ncbi:MAG: protein translocase subunit SecD [Polyangiaceae bacterium]|nr:protein translocase subunit SecD [Polyangiaceae bacterium]